MSREVSVALWRATYPLGRLCYDATSLALELKEKPVGEARRWLASARYKGVRGIIQFDDAGLRTAEASVVPIKEHPNLNGKLG